MRSRVHTMCGWILLLSVSACGAGELRADGEDSSRAASSATCPGNQVMVRLGNQELCVDATHLKGLSSGSKLLAAVTASMVNCWNRRERGKEKVCSVFDTAQMSGTVAQAALRDWVCRSTVFDYPDYDGNSRLRQVALDIFDCYYGGLGINRIDWGRVEGVPNLYSEVCLVASASNSIFAVGPQDRVKLLACERLSPSGPAAPPDHADCSDPSDGSAELCDGIDNDCNGYVDDVAPALLSADRFNCGRCGNVCPSGTYCSDGQCRKVCSRASDCPAGYQCLQGKCTRL